MEANKQHWVAMQTKTFTKWTNSKLQKGGYPTITNLFKDLETGVTLANLLSSIGKGPVKHSKNAVARIIKLENVMYVLSALKDLNVPLVNIGPSDIVDGDEKLILGLIWTIISRVDLGEALPGDMVSIRSELLDWVKAATAGYDNVSVTNFTTSWKDGLAFNAIIHNFRPNLIDYENLTSSDPIYNLNNAFDTADMKLGLPKLLDAEDVAMVDVPDEKSIITYLLQYYKKFKPEQVGNQNKKIVADFIKGLNSSISLRHDYETKARAFVKEKAEFHERLNELAYLFGTIINTLSDFEIINDELMGRSVQLSELLWRIQEAGRVQGLKPYVPAPEIASDAIDMEYFDSNLFDLKAITDTLARFSGNESRNIAEVKKGVRKILETEDPTDGIKACARLESKLSGMKEAKRGVAEQIKEVVVAHADALRTLSVPRNSMSQLLDTATRLFKLSDIKSTGTITSVAFKKIMQALKLECDWSSVQVPSEVTLQVLHQFVRNLHSVHADVPRIRAALRSLSDGNALRLEGLGVSYENVANGHSISTDVIENYLDSGK